METRGNSKKRGRKKRTDMDRLWEDRGSVEEMEWEKS